MLADIGDSSLLGILVLVLVIVAIIYFVRKI